MPQVMSSSISVGAGANSGNVLQGSIFEFLKRPAAIRIAATVPAGGAVTDVTGRLTVGDKVITDPRFPVLAESAPARGPIIPDDIKVTAVGLPGNRLSLDFQNTTAGAIRVVWWAEVSG